MRHVMQAASMIARLAAFYEIWAAFHDGTDLAFALKDQLRVLELLAESRPDWFVILIELREGRRSASVADVVECFL